MLYSTCPNAIEYLLEKYTRSKLEKNVIVFNSISLTASPSLLDEFVQAQGSAQRPLDSVHGPGLGNRGPISLDGPMPRDTTTLTTTF